MADRAMLAAGSFFAAATTFTTAVALRQPLLPDEPFGIRFPGRVPVHLALGLGSGVAAPWPMPVIALIAAARSGTGDRWPARTCAVLGAVVLVGTIAEPASWGLRPRSPAARATVALNLLSGAALFLAGTRGDAGAAVR
ncbi:hypothetical protein [Blastococcus haudaquaticus]|uniref:Uncharacterized protein n=1 Tax=Blastococcus haudaquaticus TaxID=1938745 RepID=A0A286H4P8_9ACTN|nr:hypothetical protein [Blastococcus haudaquaticus]SOE02731.1 hypothetical protein SAMN06272739_3693 [Blastococcus haudaquaticus]